MTQKGSVVDVDKLTVFATKALQKAGVSEEDAGITARMLVAADLRGVESHGVALLATSVKGIREGVITLKPKMRFFSHAPATAIMDGDRGLGCLVGYRAMEEAIKRAEKTGAGFVAVRNSTHLGTSAPYVIMAMAHDMIGIAMTTGGKGMEVPGGRGPAAGINVISIGAPTKEEAPFVLDMATTIVAGGKISIAQRRGLSIPEGWAVNLEGKPVTDPNKYRKEGGALLPLGGTPQMGSYKGFGLSVAVDILSSILSGSVAVPELIPGGHAEKHNHFYGALRIDGFMPAEDFKKSMDGMIRIFHNLPKAEGVSRIILAGELEQATEKQRRANGIPLDAAVTASLQGLAKELNMEYNL